MLSASCPLLRAPCFSLFPFHSFRHEDSGQNASGSYPPPNSYPLPNPEPVKVHSEPTSPTFDETVMKASCAYPKPPNKIFRNTLSSLKKGAS